MLITHQRIAEILLVLFIFVSICGNIILSFLAWGAGHDNYLGESIAARRSQQFELDQCRDSLSSIEEKTGIKASSLELNSN